MDIPLWMKNRSQVKGGECESCIREIERLMSLEINARDQTIMMLRRENNQCVLRINALEKELAEVTPAIRLMAKIAPNYKPEEEKTNDTI